ncbi:hypothetical protein [Hymenobacter elongatus]|uniref:Uncharacterized protein n=1 Tax=Hymenobacter elongatus TaxID=877208 RepID=A0A4Z0PFY4_9BACT|nr:hypothetical protein [Hymenobacter elongatus]TGE13113.1 hypothetical protein E5J99_19580 [Hymenobacter elongatus]
MGTLTPKTFRQRQAQRRLESRLDYSFGFRWSSSLVGAKLQLLPRGEIVLGREVLALPAARLVAGEVQLPLQTLRPGSYTLRVQGTDFTLTRQFVRAK